ncbi:MAG: hypothetical protein DWQ01_05110 [Planctomycetota bacterium]|nr:MAG: hypothetical protein DWQ01_05110 [Planctomycetota bacterium]
MNQRSTDLRRLKRFERKEAVPTTWRVLKAHFSWWDRIRLLFHSFRRAVLHDPMRKANLGSPKSEQEKLSRRQFRPVPILEDVLKFDLKCEPNKIERILGEIVAESGARFLAWNFPPVSAEEWQNKSDFQRMELGEKALSAFFNAETEDVSTDSASFAFKVHRCRFVELAQAIERPHLSSLFCQADSRFFQDPTNPYELQRPEMLASGDASCKFHILFQESR